MNSKELYDQAVTPEEQEEFTAYLIKAINPKDQKDFEDKIKNISPEEIYEIYKEYKRMKTQISYAKSGSKLLHINELRGRCPEGYEIDKYLSGGCVKCKKKAMQKDLMNGIKEELKCGGKMKKRVMKKSLGSRIKKLGPGDSTSAGSVKPNKNQSRAFKAQSGMSFPTTWEEIYGKYFVNGGGDKE